MITRRIKVRIEEGIKTDTLATEVAEAASVSEAIRLVVPPLGKHVVNTV